MIHVPACLYSNDMINAIKGFINIYHSKDFDSLHNGAKDILVSHAMTALNHDIDIILNSSTNKLFSKHLTTYSQSDLFLFMDALKQDVYEQFSAYLNQIFSDVIEKDAHDTLRDNGYMLYQDRNNGEMLMRKIS